MKKICFLLLILLVLASGIQLFAQEPSGSKQNELYTKSFDVIKIYMNRYGYKIIYWTPSGKTAELYVPVEWFETAGGKATLVYGQSPSYPNFAVTWKNGEFLNITLYAMESPAHSTWGIMKGNSDDIKTKFEIETLNLQF